MRSPDIGGLAHIGIMTKNMETAVAFYRDTLGFEIVETADLQREAGVTRIAILAAETCIVELIQPAGDVENRGGGTIDHIAMEVDSLVDVRDRLEAAGVDFETEDPIEVGIRGGARVIFFRGPDGERLELFEYL